MLHNVDQAWPLSLQQKWYRLVKQTLVIDHVSSAEVILSHQQTLVLSNQQTLVMSLQRRSAPAPSTDIGPVPSADIGPVSSRDMGPVPSTDIDPVPAANIDPVSSTDICPAPSTEVILSLQKALAQPRCIDACFSWFKLQRFMLYNVDQAWPLSLQQKWSRPVKQTFVIMSLQQK